jgi:hypothetical protein
LSAPRESAKPAEMSTSAWYGQRVRERNAAERAAQAAAWGRGTEPAAEETEVEEEPQAPAGGIRAHGSWGFRPGGGMFLRTDDGTIVA